MPKFIDLTGRKVGMLAVLSRAPDLHKGHPRYYCRCDCGKETITWAQALRENKIESCGCKANERFGQRNKDRAKHNLRGTRVWRIWQSMKQRCYLTTHTSYSNYGAKGVTVCDRWREDFRNFLEDMGHPPTRHHTIDRIKNAKGYGPDNCRWATMMVQQNNRTNNRHLTFNGKTQTIMEWSRETGISRNNIENRIDRCGYSVERALTEPVVMGRRRVRF